MANRPTSLYIYIGRIAHSRFWNIRRLLVQKGFYPKFNIHRNKWLICHIPQYLAVSNADKLHWKLWRYFSIYFSYRVGPFKKVFCPVWVRIHFCCSFSNQHLNIILKDVHLFQGLAQFWQISWNVQKSKARRLLVCFFKNDPNKTEHLHNQSSFELW